MVIRVIGHHGAKLQLIHNFRRGRHTDQPPGFPGHKIYKLRGAEFGAGNQVALVLPVLIVSNQDHLACLDSGYSFFHRVKFKIFHLELLCSLLKITVYLYSQACRTSRTCCF